MIEVEIKVRIPDPEVMRQKFREKHGKYTLSLEHEDTYFNMPKKLRDFRKTDEALRIRKSIEFDKNNEKQGQTINYFLTYKGEKLDTVSKTRKELETKAENGQVLKDILKVLTFREVFTVKKKRELYKIPFEGKKIEALIDYIPILKKHFIEVEAKAENRDQSGDARARLFRFLEKSGISKEES
ncbi:MAG: class IV adenylate cyclase, partial [Promethearchaeia archaeon]